MALFAIDARCANSIERVADVKAEADTTSSHDVLGAFTGARRVVIAADLDSRLLVKVLLHELGHAAVVSAVLPLQATDGWFEDPMETLDASEVFAQTVELGPFAGQLVQAYARPDQQPVSDRAASLFDTVWAAGWPVVDVASLPDPVVVVPAPDGECFDGLSIVRGTPEGGCAWATPPASGAPRWSMCTSRTWRRRLTLPRYPPSQRQAVSPWTSIPSMR